MLNFDSSIVYSVSKDSMFVFLINIGSNHLGFPQRARAWLTFLNFENMSRFPAQPARKWLCCKIPYTVNKIAGSTFANKKKIVEQ